MKRSGKIFAVGMLATAITIGSGAGISYASPEVTEEQRLLEEAISVYETEAGVDDQEVEIIYKEGINTAQLSQTEEAATVPGDMFYFVKQLLERVQYTLAFADQDKASLLIDFAQQRVLEAEQLIDQGEAAKAEEILKQALEIHDQAIEYQEEKRENDDRNQFETTEDLIEEGLVPDDNEVELKLSQNIISLLNVVNKVENPRAKEVITRNIERQLKHLDRKQRREEETNDSLEENSDDKENEVVNESESATDEATEESDDIVESAKVNRAEKKGDQVKRNGPPAHALEKMPEHVKQKFEDRNQKSRGNNGNGNGKGNGNN
ncbi:DUF5667 domain-containing protein [Desertibacillus haloalkaliphilus]|uniref:DUF5667 domain-containing protein n=1 Tax=Desertibacillus haloalkaliphilus TaxID=1328930 RepID=UPI001C278E58|nr:DUF5667 domain-containing protein [Desertibacillus haloalkaliphilus]MBU8907325.1 hypothetical protein [Desertibacillus haloalkaliphilus]